jgi:hypothetical protein
MTATNANWEWKRNWGMKKDSERNGDNEGGFREEGSTQGCSLGTKGIESGCVENRVCIDKIWTKQNKNRVVEKGDKTRLQSKNICLLNKLE